MDLLKHLAKAFALAVCACLPCAGEAVSANLADGVDRSDPNFVKASLIVVGPGASLYSAAGHSCFRMECPTYGLDLCFSYESESAAHRVLAFVAGNLKMGMFAIPTARFLKLYEDEGRSVRQYELQLPPDAKQRLWKVLDDAVAEGADLSYDFIKRGCAQSTLRYLREAVRPHVLAYPPWPPKYDKTLRELFADALWESPWNLFCLQVLVGTDVDADLPKASRVIIPRDLVELLAAATIDGKPVLAGAPTVLTPPTHEPKRPFFTPSMAAGLVLVLVAVGLFTQHVFLNVTLLVSQAVLGAFLSYLVFFSSLPATTWNWLLIPFNPVPLAFWKWREKWALLFVLVIVGWLGFMILSPHKLTDTAFLLLAGALALVYVKESTLANRFLYANQNKGQNKGEEK